MMRDEEVHHPRQRDEQNDRRQPREQKHPLRVVPGDVEKTLAVRPMVAADLPGRAHLVAREHEIEVLADAAPQVPTSPSIDIDGLRAMDIAVRASEITDLVRRITALTTRLPTPGRPNTVSVTTAPPIISATVNPSTVTIGTSALRNACLSTTVPSDRPLERAVRT